MYLLIVTKKESICLEEDTASIFVKHTDTNGRKGLCHITNLKIHRRRSSIFISPHQMKLGIFVRFADIVAIPLFLVGVIYFWRKSHKTAME